MISKKTTCIKYFPFLIFLLALLFAAEKNFAEEFFLCDSLPEKKDSATVKHDCGIFKIGGDSSFQYCKPKLFSFLTGIPKDYSLYAKREFKKDQIGKYAAIAVSTGLLIIADQKITDACEAFGRTIHLKGTDHQTAVANFSATIGKLQLQIPLSLPSDLNSGMYFIGDGLTHFFTAFSFWSYGKITHNLRAVSTGSQITECILSAGIATQILKHITGRESPLAKTASGGVWRFFANQKEYAAHVPAYDAFPSGHIATAVGTVTVIAINYPEYKFIKPVGYSLCGLLIFSMLNNGVHWASDYPLGIAIGYSFAKVITGKTITVLHNEHSTENSFRKKHFGKPFIFPYTNSFSSGFSAKWVF